jgi:hypothetical protein
LIKNFYLTYFCLAVALVVGGGCMHASIPLTGHWKMTDAKGAAIVTDSSGEGHDAVVGKAVAVGLGANNNAVGFSNDKESFACFDSPFMTNLTIAAWVKVTGMGNVDKPYPRVMALPGCYLHLAKDHAGRVTLTYGHSHQGKMGSWSGSGAFFLTNNWAHVAVSYGINSPEKKPVFYVNGKMLDFAAGKKTGAFKPIKEGKGFIGNTSAGNRPFCGLMSDVRLYDVLLPEKEIAALAMKTPDNKKPMAYKELFNDRLPLVDISGDTYRQVVIAAGTPEIYQGHPTTLLMPDKKTMFCVWCINHGGHAGPMARSDDGGLTWKRLDDTLPSEFIKHRNCPSIYRIVDKKGKERLWIFSSSRGIDRLMSEDGGKSWKEMPPLGFPCGMPFTGVVALAGGRAAAFGQMRAAAGSNDQGVMMSITEDGGLTWSKPRIIAKMPGKNLCEPFVIRSPDGKELCCLIRENHHTANSMMCFSRDEGETWSAPVDTCWGLSGDRHVGVQALDGRWVIAFRDRALGSSTYGQFVAWVGSYDDIRNARPGDFRIRLLNHRGSARDGYGWAYTDTGYPGMELLKDGTIVATTYTKHWDDNRKHSVVCTRFKLDEISNKIKKEYK